MAQQTINIGTAPNDGTGTPLRTSFDYCNLNFTELYTAVGPSGNNIVVPGNATITGAATVGTTLGVTGVSTFAAGTALLPALTTTGDVNTGIYYPAADTFAVTTGGTERYRVDPSGNIGVGVTPAGTGGCLQLKSGITFPATQVASSDANTLDDYEEGTFTPTVRGSTSAGTGTYTTQFGRYTKVGRLVTVTVQLVWTAHTGTGNLQFASLPFVSANEAGNYNGITIGYQSNIASTASTVLYGLIEFGAAIVSMTQTPVGGGAYGLVAMDTAGEIAFTATYYV
jgi:hypothetical protein